jgi:hypothetical protein
MRWKKYSYIDLRCRWCERIISVPLDEISRRAQKKAVAALKRKSTSAEDTGPSLSDPMAIERKKSGKCTFKFYYQDLSYH